LGALEIEQICVNLLAAVTAEDFQLAHVLVPALEGSVDRIATASPALLEQAKARLRVPADQQ
jgi:hypothetical protein